MYYTGFADEAAADIDGQIMATKTLGWKYIEARTVDGVNIHDMTDEKFEETAEKLSSAGVRINCFGSAVANWSCDPLSEDDFGKTVGQLERALRRMKRVGCDMLRGMSFKARWDRPAWDGETENNVFRKVKFLVKMCEDAGCLYLHENCNNYGGMSWKHTLKLLDHVNSPNFKLVFDTGNPVLNFDRSRGDALDRLQSSWEFYNNVKEFVHYVHIKDAIFRGKNESGGFNKAEFTYPGEGEGNVVEIVTDLLKNGYDGGFSIEPHMRLVFHAEGGVQNAAGNTANYVEYGKRLMRLIENARASLAKQADSRTL